jgi:cytochrome c peroxidase
MKLASLAISIAVVAASAFAFDDVALMKQAKDAGLKPIPANLKAFIKTLDDPKNPSTPEKLELGKMLYFEPRLSKSELISCNTCHNLGIGGVDGVPAAVGHKWTANPSHLNSPTVYNSVLNKVQFWDGRSPHLADQAQGPMQAGPEMASPKELVEQRVTSMPGYVEAFQKAYGKNHKITFESIADTIAIYEKTLVTPAPFDAYLNGDKNAMTTAQKEGMKLFLDKGCAACHTDMAIGGTMQPIEVAAKYKFAKGDFKGDKNGMVKTPTLRNITETAPYFHNGQVWDLRTAIKEMGSTQLGTDINDKDADKIAVFLGALTGKKPTIVYPQLPVISDKTPKPSFD